MQDALYMMQYARCKIKDAREKFRKRIENKTQDENLM